jgi:two-component system, NtrC family, response regulator AtoC
VTGCDAHFAGSNANTRSTLKRPGEGDTVDRRRRNELPDGLWLVVSAETGVSCVPLRDVDTVLGRGATCDIRVEDDSVSRTHAILRSVGRGARTIEDLGSRNGTVVGSHKLAKGERATLAPGMVVQLGSVTLLLLGRPASPAGTVRDASATGNFAGEPIVLDPTMRRLYALLDVIAPSPLSVLVLGETGTGKEVFAAEIHARSKRAKKPFLQLNCATLSGSLLESELFGHERGAFTGAAAAKAGLFEAADEGTLFLDEIGEMPIETQAKVLRALDSGQVFRLGSVTPRKVDVRYVAATNRNIAASVAEGTFRSDLLYRLNGFEITIPPLRKRHGEVLALAEHFIRRAAKRAKSRAPGLSDATRDAILGYAWPGNVRELRTTMERAFTLATTGAIEPEHLMLPDAAAESAGSLNDDLARQEKTRVLDALRRAKGNQTEAAKLLGVSRRTIISKIEAFGIDRPRKGSAPK